MNTLALLLVLASASVQAFTPSSGMGVVRHSGISMAAKKAVAKKPVAKKPVAKKTVAKKTVAKKAAPPTSKKGRSRNPLFGIDSGSVARKSGVSLAELKVTQQKPIDGIGAGRKGELSTALPFLDYPSNLDGNMIGDVGFDPLGFAKTPELLNQYRLAELKHGRIAMLAAVGFIVSEEEDFSLAQDLGLPSLLTDTDGRALDVVAQVNPLFFLATLAVGGYLDTVLEKKYSGSDIIGDIGFDPLKIFPKDEAKQSEYRLAEIKHGRIAMLATLVFVLDEEFLKVPVIDLIKDETGGKFPIPSQDVGGYNAFEAAKNMVSFATDFAQHLG